MSQKQIKKAYLQQEKESRTCGSQQRRKFIIFKFLLNNHAFIQEDIYNTKSILSLWGTELKYLTLYINLMYCNTVGLLNSSITWRWLVKVYRYIYDHISALHTFLIFIKLKWDIDLNISYLHIHLYAMKWKRLLSTSHSIQILLYSHCKCLTYSIFLSIKQNSKDHNLKSCTKYVYFHCVIQ